MPLKMFNWKKGKIFYTYLFSDLLSCWNFGVYSMCNNRGYVSDTCKPGPKSFSTCVGTGRA